MLPCLECAAFRTWVMPRLRNVFRFWATALGGKHNTNEKKSRRNISEATANNKTHTVYSLSRDPANNSARQPTVMPRHSHISYVEVRPDFIHWSEFQIAGIQDVLQLFNERQLLLLFARRHSPCTAAPIQRSALAVCAHRQVTAKVRGLAFTERHEQVAVSNAAPLQN